MGCCSSQGVNRHPGIPIQHNTQMINHPVFRLQPHCNSFSHNKLIMQFIEKVIDDHAWIGEGIKKTPAFRTILTYQGLKKWRQDFWKTTQAQELSMTEANKIGMQSNQPARLIHVIYSLSQLSSLEDGVAIIQAQGLIMNSTSLSLIYDHKGKAYFVPMSCINDPLDYFVEKIQDPNGPVEVKSMTLLIRNTKYGDKSLKVQNTDTIRKIKSQYQQKVKEPIQSTIRLFYNGKELSDDHKIFYYDIEAQKLIHAFIRNN